jgi:hypothetical protein
MVDTISIRNNNPCSLTVQYVGGSGEITLLPGINLNIPVLEIECLQNHPMFKTWIAHKKIDILTKTPKVEGDLEGFKVSTRKEDDQPIPHQSAKLGKDSVKPAVNKNNSNLTVLDVPELTVKEAEEIIKNSNSVEQLMEVQEKDPRKTVTTAISNRIKELEGVTL